MGGKDPDGCLLVGGHSRDYIIDLQRSVFCVVLPGNGWGHIEEPVIHGCIPVIVMPGIHVQLEGVLNITRFTIRIERDQLPRLVDILRAIPPSRVAELQAELAKVWERFTYSALFKREHTMQLRPPDALTRSRVGAQPDTVFSALEPRLRGADATDALVAHLRNRLLLYSHEATRGGALQGGGAAAACAPVPPRTSWPTVPPVDHGPSVPQWPAVNVFVRTSGVV